MSSVASCGSGEPPITYHDRDVSTDLPLDNSSVQSEPKLYPFNQSPLWQEQREFFLAAGSEAWTKGIVPHYVTSNPTMAKAYVELLIAYWQDALQQHRIDEKQPLYILELGAGSGVFSYALLRQLFSRLASSSLSHLNVVYIISDFVMANIDFCREHPKLASYIEKGQVDFALFDSENDQQLQLLNSNVVMTQNSIINPMALTANYVFDGLVQDLLYIDSGDIYQAYIALPEKLTDEHLPPETMAFDWQLLQSVNEKPVNQQQLINWYQKNLENYPVLIPQGALDCLDNIHALCGDSLLVLSADKGFSDESQLKAQGEPLFAFHGSFSLPVNYHALAYRVEQQGGLALHSPYREDGLLISALLQPSIALKDKQDNRALLTAFEQQVMAFNPDDADLIKQSLEVTAPQLTAQQMLAYLRLSQWDYRILSLCIPTLMDLVGEMSPELRNEWVRSLRLTYESYYPLTDSNEPRFNMGALAEALGAWGLAVECFHSVLESYGDDALTLYHLSCCYAELGELHQAIHT